MSKISVWPDGIGVCLKVLKTLSLMLQNLNPLFNTYTKEKSYSLFKVQKKY